MTPTELKTLRNKWGLTQEKIARVCGVAVSIVIGWENAKSAIGKLYIDRIDEFVDSLSTVPESFKPEFPILTESQAKEGLVENNELWDYSVQECIEHLNTHYYWVKVRIKFLKMGGKLRRL